MQIRYCFFCEYSSMRITKCSRANCDMQEKFANFFVGLDTLGLETTVQGNSFVYHWTTIPTIVNCLVLQNLPRCSEFYSLGCLIYSDLLMQPLSTLPGSWANNASPCFRVKTARPRDDPFLVDQRPTTHRRTFQQKEIYHCNVDRLCSLKVIEVIQELTRNVNQSNGILVRAWVM